MFERILKESYDVLQEQAMTVRQRQKVASLKRSGWEILKKDGDKVVMKKDGKEVFVYSTGKTFFIKEGKEVDITEMVDALGDEL